MILGQTYNLDISCINCTKIWNLSQNFFFESIINWLIMCYFYKLHNKKQVNNNIHKTGHDNAVLQILKIENKKNMWRAS